jgi:hypothetical protein
MGGRRDCLWTWCLPAGCTRDRYRGDRVRQLDREARFAARGRVSRSARCPGLAMDERSAGRVRPHHLHRRDGRLVPCATPQQRRTGRCPYGRDPCHFGTGISVYSRGGASWISPWRSRSVLDTATSELWWEGGADTAVHPSWKYDVPVLGPTSVRLSGPEPQTEFTFDVEVVADDVPAFKHTYVVKVPRDK